MNCGILPEDEVAATRLPLHEASTLSPAAYVSETWYRLEVERLFSREWLCVGREEQVPKEGDYFRIDLVGEPLVVVRGKDGVVRAHSAVCRHRGAILVEGEGNCRAFRCPYHGWTYALSGELRGTPGPTPPMSRSVGFDRSDYGLLSLRLETWEGFLFVSFDPAIEPLRERLGGLPTLVEAYRLAELVLAGRHRWTIAANWKLPVEGMEDYHLRFLHEKYMTPDDARMKWELTSETGRFDALRGSMDGEGHESQMFVESTFGNIEGLSRPRDLTFINVYPNFQLGLTGKFVIYRQLLPEGPERVCVTENWLFPRATVAHPGFAERVEPLFERPLHQVYEQDLEIAVSVQRGMRSRLTRPGRYSYREANLHAFANYVLDRILGPSSASERPTEAGGGR